MANPPRDPTRFSLRRWSQRKLEATRKTDAVQARDEAPAKAPPSATDARADMGVATACAHAGSGAAATAKPTAVVPDQGVEAAQRLPAIESLSIESDFTPFMQPGVNADVKRLALRKLLRDPRFNVMDGLDVYIDDYSKPDPIDPAIVRTLMQARYIFDPPKTRVNAEGHVEDVPAEAAQADAADEATQTAPAFESAAPADAASARPAATEERHPDVHPVPLDDSKTP